MNLEELKSLDFEDPGAWPLPAKAIAAGFVALLIIGVGYFMKIKNDVASLEALRNQEQTLFQEFQRKHQRAAKLEELTRQLEQMKKVFDAMKRQLPSKTEMPQLLQELSAEAIETGIDIDLFRPESEVRRDFYAEQPISLRMEGGYHEFGRFVSEVASLERVVILTMHDINLRPVAGDSSDLLLSGTVKTYRYLESNEEGGQ